MVSVKDMWPRARYSTVGTRRWNGGMIVFACELTQEINILFIFGNWFYFFLIILFVFGISIFVVVRLL